MEYQTLSEQLPPVWNRKSSDWLIDLACRLKEHEQGESDNTANEVELWHQVILLAKAELQGLQPQPSKDSLFKQDYYVWVKEQIRLLHLKQFEQLDINRSVNDSRLIMLTLFCEENCTFISKKDMGEKWSFTVEDGHLYCLKGKGENNSDQIVFTTGDGAYAVNKAATLDDIYKYIENIRREEPVFSIIPFYKRKISIRPIEDRGTELCRSAKVAD